MEPKPESSGCMSIVLLFGLIFLIGIGSCAALILKAEYQFKQEEKVEEKFLENILQKIRNHKAEPLEKWLFALAMRDSRADSFKLKFADKQLIDSSLSSADLYQKYLVMAANAGSPEAQLGLANLLYEKNHDFLYHNAVDITSEQAHEIRQAISLVEKATIDSCLVFNPNFIEYPDVHKYYETDQISSVPYWLDTLLEITEHGKHHKIIEDASLVLLYNVKHCETEVHSMDIDKNQIAELVYAKAAHKLTQGRVSVSNKSLILSTQIDNQLIERNVESLLKTYHQRYTKD